LAFAACACGAKHLTELAILRPHAIQRRPVRAVRFRQDGSRRTIRSNAAYRQ
jgi:hypothetical protein